MTDYYRKLVEALRWCDADFIHECDNCLYVKYKHDKDDCMDRMLRDAADAIEALQAQLPKRGEWIHVEGGESYHYECSKCGERPLYSRYGDVVLSGVCPMCGAKMEVQE